MPTERLLRLLRRLRLLVCVIVPILGGCASTLAPQNHGLLQADASSGYRYAGSDRPLNDGLLINLSFSGGGTRAAALSYGVLQALAKTMVQVQGRERRLLDQVESISAVSGGSYTAAYYGLFGDRIFADFEARFLKRDVQSEMVDAMFSPGNLFRLTSPFFGRSNVVAEYLNDTLFEHKTFGDMLDAQRKSSRPFVQINATDMGRVSRFEFTQEMFDLICADLSAYPIASAVAASSAVPVLLSPITLKNFAGQCGYVEPAWMEAAVRSRASLRRYNVALDLRSYLDADKRAYVHLVDGGVSDNLALRGSLDRLSVASAADLAALYQVGDVRRIVQIVVNAQARVDFPEFDRSAEVPSLGAIAFTVSNATDRYSIETLALLRERMGGSVEAIKAHRRKLGLTDADDVKAYLIEISFDALADPAEREYFNQLPTSFYLPDEAVDRLTAVAGKILRASPGFAELLVDLR